MVIFFKMQFTFTLKQNPQSCCGPLGPVSLPLAYLSSFPLLGPHKSSLVVLQNPGLISVLELSKPFFLETSHTQFPSLGGFTTSLPGFSYLLQSA